MSESALERVARALDLIPFIAKNPGHSVEELATIFDSTPAQISKDLSLLHMCGLPGYTHLELLDIDYEDPQYVSVLDAQVLDRPRSLSQMEILTLVLGLEMLQELTSDDVERAAIKNLQARLSAVLGEELSRAISIADAVVDSPLASQISEAIALKRFLSITYNSISRDLLSEKELFPLELYYHNGIGYLRAYEVGVDEMRIYRLDRIIRLELGARDENFVEDISSSRPAENAIDIVITMGSDGYFFLEKHNEIVTSFTETATGYQIHLRVSLGEWIIRTLLSWHGAITVQTPSELAQIIRDRTASALANYQ